MLCASSPTTQICCFLYLSLIDTICSAAHNLCLDTHQQGHNEIAPDTLPTLRDGYEITKSIEKQIIKVHCISLPAALPITIINITNSRHFSKAITLISLFIFSIICWSIQIILALDIRDSTVLGLYCLSFNPNSLIIECIKLLLSVVS